MNKKSIHPCTCLTPVPAVMVTCGEEEKANVITIAWVGTVNSDPPMVSISVRPARYSHSLIAESGEFVVNIPSPELVEAMDYCGTHSGRSVDKFAELGFTKGKSEKVGVPYIAECPIALECKVRERLELGSHTMFVGEIVNVIADENLVANGKLQVPSDLPVAYNNQQYARLGAVLGTYGFTAVRK